MGRYDGEEYERTPRCRPGACAFGMNGICFVCDHHDARCHLCGLESRYGHRDGCLLEGKILAQGRYAG